MEITVDLATEVLGGRVLAIHRSSVMTENDRPSDKAIFGQLIEPTASPLQWSQGRMILYCTMPKETAVSSVNSNSSKTQCTQ